MPKGESLVGRWVTTEDTRYNDFMAKPKEYLVRLIMGLGDMARYEQEKIKRRGKGNMVTSFFQALTDKLHAGEQVGRWAKKLTRSFTHLLICS